MRGVEAGFSGAAIFVLGAVDATTWLKVKGCLAFAGAHKAFVALGRRVLKVREQVISVSIPAGRCWIRGRIVDAARGGGGGGGGSSALM